MVGSGAGEEGRRTGEGLRPKALAATTAEAAPEPSGKVWGDCEAGTTEADHGTTGVKAPSGATELSGPAILGKGKVTVCVNRQLQQIAAPSEDPPKYSTDGVAFGGGRYKVKLKDKLLPNQDVIVVVTS